MRFFKRLFGKKEAAIATYASFWAWFQEHEQSFAAVVRNKGNIQRKFFDPVTPRLRAIREGFFMLTGMYDPNTVELVVTAEGNVQNFVWVEELIAAAPTIPGWRFTALKPGKDLDKFGVVMEGYTFDLDTISFYAIEDPHYPDEISITMVHSGLIEGNRSIIENGCHIFIDNFLGELTVATMIDNIAVTSPQLAAKPLVPMNKLRDYLQWRKAEFVEKYEGEFLLGETRNYAILEAKLANGMPLIATINQDLLRWDRKASHPWMMVVEIGYENANNGMPDSETSEVMREFEEKLDAHLPSAEGYLNIGRQTSEGCRAIFVACKDFRKPCKVIALLQKEYQEKLKVSSEVFKDKYWRSVDHFVQN